MKTGGVVLNHSARLCFVSLAETSPQTKRHPAGRLFLTRKPQAMLVDEKSTSVETVKKEPPFATIEAGNANRTKAKGGSSIWTKKVYHIRVGIANIT